MNEREDAPPDLGHRVEQLERTVAALERRLAALDATSAISATDTAQGPRTATPAPVARKPALSPGRIEAVRTTRPTIPLVSGDPGQWVNRLGIALLLLGAALGFKYSVDQGWIGPALRVLFGLGLGIALLAASAGVRRTRPGLSRVLAGGGIASGYLSVYAAFQLYHLISYGGAFAAMSAVTATAFVLAMRDDDAMIATLAAIGGLATPILLYTAGRDLSGLVGYTCLVVLGAGAVFARSGWRVLLWTTAVGGWFVFASAAWQVHAGATAGAGVVQGGILVLALATWWLAVMRELLSADDPHAWRPTRFGFADEVVRSFVPEAGDGNTQAHQLTLLTPILVLALSTWTWKLEETSTGWLALSLAIGWGGAAVHLRSLAEETAHRLATTHAVGAAVMLAFAMSFLLGEDARRFGLAAEALALLVLARRAGDPRSAMLGHALFAVISLEASAQMLDRIGRSSARFGATEVSALGVVVALAAGAALQSGAARIRYVYATQAGLLLWFLGVFDPLPNGAALVTAAWFLNAVVLVVAGLRIDSAAVRAAGAAVMALTMAKLFLFDLSTVDAGWRIVTFLGFGAALLGLGYAFPALWRRDSKGQPGDRS